MVGNSSGELPSAREKRKILPAISTSLVEKVIFLLAALVVVETEGNWHASCETGKAEGGKEK
jgi:hypothetical protein